MTGEGPTNSAKYIIFDKMSENKGEHDLRYILTKETTNVKK